MTRLEIAKTAANVAVHAAAAKIIRNLMTSHTSMDEDSIAVSVASGVGGMYVAGALQEQTDELVELAAQKIAEKRAQKIAA